MDMFVMQRIDIDRIILFTEDEDFAVIISPPQHQFLSGSL